MIGRGAAPDIIRQGGALGGNSQDPQWPRRFCSAGGTGSSPEPAPAVSGSQPSKVRAVWKHAGSAWLWIFCKHVYQVYLSVCHLGCEIHHHQWQHTFKTVSEWSNTHECFVFLLECELECNILIETPRSYGPVWKVMFFFNTFGPMLGGREGQSHFFCKWSQGFIYFNKTVSIKMLTWSNTGNI